MKKYNILTIILSIALIISLSTNVSAIGSKESEIGSHNFGTFEYKDDNGSTIVRINADDIKTVAGYVDEAETHVSSVEARMDQIYDPDGNGGVGTGTLLDIEAQVDAISDAVNLDSSISAAPTNVLSGKKYITKGTDGKLTVETGSMTNYKNATSNTGSATDAMPTDSGNPGDPSFTASAVINLPAGYYDGNTPIDVSTIANHYYLEGKADATPDMTPQTPGAITDWSNFHGKVLIGTYGSTQAVNLSYITGYQNLTNNNFYYVTSNMSDQLYNTNQTGNYPRYSYIAPVVSYNASTGILSITPAMVKVAQVYNVGASAGQEGNWRTSVVSTSVYLLK